MGTKLNPGDFDCYSNALNDEPMFVLLARDEKSPSIVRYWAQKYKEEKEKASIKKRLTVEQYKKFNEALDCADAMDTWRNNWRNLKAVTEQKNKCN